MSRHSLGVAEEHGRRLPEFGSQAEAERALFALRDQRLAKMTRWATSSSKFSADGSAESLKAIESWYFEIVANPEAAIGGTRSELEACLGAYFGQVFVESADFTWIVEPYAFVPGRYSLGVRKGLRTLMVTNGIIPEPLQRNRRKQSLFRQYQRYAT